MIAETVKVIADNIFGICYLGFCAYILYLWSKKDDYCLADSEGSITLSREEAERQLEALKANHEWHQEYDEYGAYPDSTLEKQNYDAITLIQNKLTKGEVK